MNISPKKVEALTVKDIDTHPVWRYLNDNQIGETAVQPVLHLPVNNLDGKVVGTRVKLSNREILWAFIGNMSVSSQELNEHFLTITILRDGERFAMARYHDPDYEKRGPKAMANFLGLQVDQVFPISYDLRQYVKGNPDVLVGEIRKEPRKKLTGDQLIAMVLR